MDSYVGQCENCGERGVTVFSENGYVYCIYCLETEEPIDDTPDYLHEE